MRQRNIRVVNQQDQFNRRNNHSEVGLSEFIQADVALNPCTEEHHKWLAHALGFSWIETETIKLSAKKEVLHAQKMDQIEINDGPIAREISGSLELLDPVDHIPTTFELAFKNHTKKIRSAIDIKPPSEIFRGDSCNFRPLFREQWFLGIISTVLAIQEESREIDHHQLRRIISKAHVFERLPLLTRSTVSRGVHVLLDHSESMQPFWRDQDELVNRLQRILGKIKVKIDWFEYNVFRPIESRLFWHTRMPNRFTDKTPILVVSDFGIGDNPSLARYMEWDPWFPVLQRARSSHCRTFALIPAPSTYWPEDINRFFNGFLIWDRKTSPQTAARVCRKSPQTVRI